MSESSKIITRHLVIDKDLLILGDMKMSLNILKIRENKDKPGELTLAWKFECYETDTLTTLNSFQTVKEIGKFPPAEGPEDEETHGCVVIAGSKSNCV